MRKIALSLLLVFVAVAAFSLDDGATPVGANTAQDLYSPIAAGGGGFTTSRGGSWASALNPAAEGAAQRVIFDLGYMGLYGFGEADGDSGFGTGAINAGAIVPTRYGVFGGSLRFLQSPFDSFAVGTSFQGNLNAAKEIYPGMSVGAGLNVGGNDWNAFTLSGDLGFRYNIGNLGHLENFTWAAVARGLGASMIPPAFTPSGGVAFDVLRIPGGNGRPDPLRMRFSADLMLPSFQNAAGKMGLNILVAELVSISTSTQFNIRESINGAPPSPVPSIGIGVNWTLRSNGRIAGGKIPEGELAADVAAKPLYNGIWAMGGALTWTVGIADRTPPVITAQYPEPAWISPNNDGRADYLEFPLSITDERYIMEWIFLITDEFGTPVREIRNVDPRQQTQGVKDFISRLRAVRGGVEIPPSLRWDGAFDSGEIAPDGRYFFTITATDDSGNTGHAGPFEVNVDNTPPEISVRPFTGVTNIFAPGGNGARPTLAIEQSGSREDLWEAGVYNAASIQVRAFTFVDSEPSAIVWDGRDDNGLIVPDGVYTYRIAATDRAQNMGEASLANIIVNTIRPRVALLIDNAHFSPNRDGVQDTMNFTLDVPVKDGIVNWNVQILDAAGTVRRVFAGGEDSGSSALIPVRFEFDGYADGAGARAGAILPEGLYYARLEVRYENGHLSSAVSPTFTLDVTPPRASIQIDGREGVPGRAAVFAPNTDSPRNELIIFQQGSDEQLWIGEVRRAVPSADAGSLVRTFRFSGVPPARIVWDGVTDAGSLAPDGLYTYELFSTDLAGNSGRSNIVSFEIYTRDTPVMIATNIRAFSPNGDGVKDTINLIPHLQETSGVVNWRIDVQKIGSAETAAAATNATSGAAVLVRRFEGSGVPPAQVVWNGRDTAGNIAQDGVYIAVLEVEYHTGVRPTALSMSFELDTIPPQAEISVPFTVFSPNATSNRDTLPINVTSEGNDEWDAAIVNRENRIVRAWNWTGRAPAVPLMWDGTDAAGNPVPDGSYTILLSSTDEAGNSMQTAIRNIVVDTRVPAIFLTASAQAIAPRPNQAEAMRFNIIPTIPDGIEFWQLELRDESGSIARVFPAAQGETPRRASGALPAFIPWNGANGQGVIQEGRFTPVLTVHYTKGDVVTVSTPPVLVDISGPVLRFRSTPEFFSPDNDGVDDELFIFLTAIDASPIAQWSLEIRETEGGRQVFYRIEGRGSPAERIIWDGRSNWGELVQSATDYEWTFRAADTLGNASSLSGRITTDVLVIRDGNILRIQVPSITFRANHADFTGIPQERLDTNLWVLRRIAEILNRFRDYRITVEGHANPVLGTAVEETNQLQPLSLARAQAVIEHLAKNGVTRARLSPVGRGGTMPVAAPLDQNNNWKNRRVEFLLIR